MFSLQGPLAKPVLTLAIGAAGGFVFSLIGLPAPWLSGSMVAATIAALSRVPLRLPAPLRDVVFVVLGISMGAGFTPETLDALNKWPLSLLGLALSIPAIIVGAAVFLRRFAHWDSSTAFFASVPGALSFVMALTLESRADPRLVALAQSLRLFVLVALLPSLIVATSPAAAVVAPVVTPGALDGVAGVALLLATGTLFGVMLERLSVPGGLLIGAMTASAVLHATDVVRGQLPDLVLMPCFVALGCFIGLRFEGTSVRQARQALWPSLGAFLVSLAVAGSFAVVVAWSLALPLGQVLLAFAPGGIEAMTVLAFALDLDPAYVGTHQLARFVGIALVLPFIARPYRRLPGE